MVKILISLKVIASFGESHKLISSLCSFSLFRYLQIIVFIVVYHISLSYSRRVSIINTGEQLQGSQ